MGIKLQRFWQGFNSVKIEKDIIFHGWQISFQAIGGV